MCSGGVDMNHLLLVFDSSSQTHIGEFGSPRPGLMLFQCFLNCMRERIMGVDCSVLWSVCQVVVIKLSPFILLYAPSI